MEKKKIRIRDFAYGSVILMISNIVLKAANFFFLPLYTKYLSPAEMGISDTISNFTAFILPLLICGFDSAFSVFYFDEKDEYRHKKVFNTVQITMFRTSMVILLLFFAAKPLSILLFDKTAYTLAIDISLLGVALNLWMLAFSMHIRMQNRMLVMGVINIITSLSMLIMNVIFVVYFKWGYLSLIISSTAAFAIQFLLYILCGRIKIEYTYYDKKLFKDMLKYAVPMLPLSIVNWILALSDRYIILYFWSEEAVGLYGIANRFVTVLNVVTSSITTAFTTFAFANAQEKDAKEQYSKVLNYVYIILMMAVLTISIFAKPIIEIMTDKRYFESYILLQPLLFGQICYCVATIIGYGFAHAHKSKYFLIPSASAMVINVVLNVVFVSEYGAYAAALTTLAGYMVMLLVTYFLAGKIYPCRYEIGKIAVTLAVGYLLAWCVRDQAVYIQGAAWVFGMAGILAVFHKSAADILQLILKLVKKRK